LAASSRHGADPHTEIVRSFLAVLLVLVATALTFPATLAVWQQRVIMDRTSFVALSNDVLEKDAVQVALAERLATDVTAVDPRLETSTARSIALAVLAGLPGTPAADTALSATHSLLVNLIRNERLDTEAGTIVFDLRPVIDQVLADIGLNAVQLPADTGRIVLIRSEDLTAALRTARFLDSAAPFVVAAPAVVLLLALLIAPNRSLMLALAAVAIAAAAGVRILLLESALGGRLIDDALLDPDARAAATATYDVLAASLIRQEVVVMLIGAVLLGLGVAVSLLKGARAPAEA
jgi:hypothetical protein